MQIASETDIMLFVSGAVTGAVAAAADRTRRRSLRPGRPRAHPGTFGDGLTPFNTSATKTFDPGAIRFAICTALIWLSLPPFSGTWAGLNPRFDHGSMRGAKCAFDSIIEAAISAR